MRVPHEKFESPNLTQYFFHFRAYGAVEFEARVERHSITALGSSSHTRWLLGFEFRMLFSVVNEASCVLNEGEVQYAACFIKGRTIALGDNPNGFADRRPAKGRSSQG